MPWSFVLPVALLVACKPQAGASCDEKQANKAVCQDPSTALICFGGKWETLPCRGPSGCAMLSSRKITCENDDNVAGEVCNGSDVECSLDKTAKLKCEGHRWKVRQDCGADHVCTSRGEYLEVACQPKPGSACNAAVDTKVFCVDEPNALVCLNGKWETMRCRGPSACDRSSRHDDTCNTLAVPGEYCDGSAALAPLFCSEDATSKLKCVDKRFAVAEACPAGTRCVGAWVGRNWEVACK
jgi:hypothetical protein